MSDARKLFARTRRLEGPVDLIGMGAGPGRVLWTNDEMGLAGEGVALEVDLDATSEALSAIDTTDDVGLPGSGPVAFAALPFHLGHGDPDHRNPGHSNPGRGARLVVPARIVGRRGDVWWETVVGRRGAPEPPRHFPTAASTAERSPDGFTLSPSMPHDEWMQAVADATCRIAEGELEKVVLARRVDVVANRPFVLGEVLSRLQALYPTCMVFHFGGFVGASPELLVRREGEAVSSHPLAGTVARSGDRAADKALVAALLDSVKQRWEHRIVIDHLVEVLGPYCDRLEVPDAPSVLGLRNVSHLATPIAGHLARRGGRIPSALELAAALHPTAAVGGHPRELALAYLEKVEGFDRGAYAGPVGWVDGRGDGSWALGIRSAVIDGNRASIYAGNGIVAGSDPASELAETQLKLQALLAALVRP